MRSEHPPIGDAAWRAREQARRRREWLLQGVLAALLIAVVAGLAFNTAANLEARQIRSGFGFLAGQAGFDVGEALIEYSARDSYLRAFVAGMLNTLRVAAAGIVLATLLGIAIGLARLAQHPLVAGVAAVWVEVSRNIPLLILLLCIYLVVTELLPDATSPLALAGFGLLSKQGLQIAIPAQGALALVLALAVSLAAGATAFALGRRRVTSLGAAARALPAALVAAIVAWLAVGAIGGWSRPQIEGFLISGGASLTPEFLALWLGLAFFTSGAIAEIVRAGAEAVPRGQWHAALALGLTRGQAISSVIFPQGLRLAIPPLSSQYMNLTKNSSLAVIIGYPDLVSVANTSINQNGQALEAIVVIMAVYLTLNLAISVLMNALNARVTRAPR
jgi:general L-amino acid transport system permease protein